MSKKSCNKLNWKRELIEIVLIWMLGGLVNFIFWCEGCLEDRRLLLMSMVASGSFWVLLWKGSQYMVRFLDTLLPWIDYPIKRFFVSLISVVGYTTMVVYGLDIAIDMSIMGKSFSQAIRYTNYSSLPFAILITLSINIFMHGRGFLFAWRQAAIDMEKLKTEHISTQYQSLKNQVNPHFLFNSLNALSSLVYDDQDRAVEFIRKLSHVYRYVLDKKDEELVPLKEELDFTENYLYLQQIRFGTNLQIATSGQVEDVYVPPLAIQLLVENAIKHNVISEQYPLHISVTFENQTCTVTNTIHEKIVKDSTGIGLANLKARYHYLTDKEVRVKNERGLFSVSVPLLKVKE